MALIRGQRYTFYTKEHTFRAEYVEILQGNAQAICTIVLRNYNEDRHIRTMPFDWITKVESLHDIIPVLPTDILLLIDNFT